MSIFREPVNSGYCATVVTIKEVLPLENCDNVGAVNFFGFQAIVSKDTPKGTKGVLFTPETQLSDEYCFQNNLFRDATRNKDEAKGYIETNRRIRAVKFRGHVSNALFMPLSSFSYLGVSEEDFNDITSFDAVLGKEICCKYIVPTSPCRGGGGAEPKQTRIDAKFLPEHISTQHYLRYINEIGEEEDVVVTQKLHGTSIRAGHTYVPTKLSWMAKKLSKWFPIQSYHYELVIGSRKVIKDIDGAAPGYYNTDIWNSYRDQLNDLLPMGYILYGEIIGYTQDGGAIQGGYTYQHAPCTSSLYVYRVAHINEQGYMVDLSWDQLKEFCKQRGLLYTPELWRGKRKDLDHEAFMDTTYHYTYLQAVPVDEGKVDEGICIRAEGLIPRIYKLKAPLFLEHETKLLDKLVEDIESSQS